MNIITLELEHILEIHRVSILEFGGFEGYYSHTISSVESILNQQYPVFGYEKYPSVFDKASMLSYFFAKDHCFRDGNKRVALGVLDLFLYLNGYEVTLDNDKAEELIYTMAESKYRGFEIDRFIFSLSEIIKRNVMPRD